MSAPESADVTEHNSSKTEKLPGPLVDENQEEEKMEVVSELELWKGVVLSLKVRTTMNELDAGVLT